MVNIFHTIHGMFHFQENIYSCVKLVDHLHNSGRHLGFACTSCVNSTRESPGLQARWHRLAHVCATWWHNILEWVGHVHTTLGTGGEGWSPPCSLRWPCGPETCFFFGCLVCYVIWLEVPKIKPGLGHSLADWCFYNLMPECVFHGTRTRRNQKAQDLWGWCWRTFCWLRKLNLASSACLESADHISCACSCSERRCTCSFWERAWEWSHGCVHSCPKDWSKTKRLWLALWSKREQTTLAIHALSFKVIKGLSLFNKSKGLCGSAK